MAKRALITGVTGQDGAYLAQYLLDLGYEVTGTYRAKNLWRLSELEIADHGRLKLVRHDIADTAASLRLVADEQPDEIYNLAAQSAVGLSFQEPLATAQATGMGALGLLEAARQACPGARFFQASSCQVFGDALASAQDETTPHAPNSPYAFAKELAHWATVSYRDGYGMYAVNGILFNHESPLRGLDAVTRKISDGVARIRAGKIGSLPLGSLDAGRDWGYAAEYVRGMHAMLQQDRPWCDMVLATGKLTTVREFATAAFAAAGMRLEWRGKGLEEKAVDADTGETRVTVDPAQFRPSEPRALCGNATLARERLGWQARTAMAELARIMVEADLRRFAKATAGS